MPVERPLFVKMQEIGEVERGYGSPLRTRAREIVTPRRLLDLIIFFARGPLTDMAFRSMPDMTNMAAAFLKSLKEDFIGHSEHGSKIKWRNA